MHRCKWISMDWYNWLLTFELVHGHCRALVHKLKVVGVGVYRQACSGISLAVRFVGRDRLLWNSMVQGTQRFRQVRAASCVIPYVLCGCLYCLRCWWFGGGPCPPLYIREDRVTWKVLAEYSWSPSTTQLGSFLCTSASSTSIRVVTREVI